MALIVMTGLYVDLNRNLRLFEYELELIEEESGLYQADYVFPEPAFMLACYIFQDVDLGINQFGLPQASEVETLFLQKPVADYILIPEWAFRKKNSVHKFNFIGK